MPGEVVDRCVALPGDRVELVGQYQVGMAAGPVEQGYVGGGEGLEERAQRVAVPTPPAMSTALPVAACWLVNETRTGLLSMNTLVPTGSVFSWLLWRPIIKWRSAVRSGGRGAGQ